MYPIFPKEKFGRPHSQLFSDNQMKIIEVPYISVVIPVYKEQGCLSELYQRLKMVLVSITPNFEIIMIEDCGADGSWETIVKFAEQDSRVKGFQFSRNFGQHYAITAGLDHCNGDWVVVMDCDLQDRPEEIVQLYQKAQEGYDVVLAKRGERQDSIIKIVFSRLFYKIFNYLADIKRDQESGNFCIISRKVVLIFREMREQLRFFPGLVDWMGFDTARVEVQHAERFEGKSSYNLKKLLKLGSEIITASSDKPLRLFIKFGFITSLAAFIYGLYILIQALLHQSPILGWSSLIVSIYFIGGIIISILGIIGIYLGKTFEETKKRPLYIIADKI